MGFLHFLGLAPAGRACTSQRQRCSDASSIAGSWHTVKVQVCVSSQTGSAYMLPSKHFLLALPKTLPYTVITYANLQRGRNSMAIQTVGLLSAGDMGHVVGQVLLQHGMRVVTCLQGRSARTCMLSRQAGIAEVSTYEQLVREADLVLSILVPEEALNTARVVAQALRSAGDTTLYADCNAVSHRTVRAIAEVITKEGSRCV